MAFAHRERLVRDVELGLGCSADVAIDHEWRVCSLEFADRCLRLPAELTGDRQRRLGRLQGIELLLQGADLVALRTELQERGAGRSTTGRDGVSIDTDWGECPWFTLGPLELVQFQNRHTG